MICGISLRLPTYLAVFLTVSVGPPPGEQMAGRRRPGRSTPPRYHGPGAPVRGGLGPSRPRVLRNRPLSRVCRDRRVDGDRLGRGFHGAFRGRHVAAWYGVVAEPVRPCALSTGLCIVDLLLHLLVPGIDLEAVRRALVADSKSDGAGHGAEQRSCDDGAGADEGCDLEMLHWCLPCGGVGDPCGRLYR